MRWFVLAVLLAVAAPVASADVYFPVRQEITATGVDLVLSAGKREGIIDTMVATLVDDDGKTTHEAKIVRVSDHATVIHVDAGPAQVKGQRVRLSVAPR